MSISILQMRKVRHREAVPAPGYTVSEMRSWDLSQTPNHLVVQPLSVLVARCPKPRLIIMLTAY